MPRRRITREELGRLAEHLATHRVAAVAYLRKRARRNGGQVYVPRSSLLDTFIATRSYARTGAAWGVSTQCVRGLVRATVKHLTGELSASQPINDQLVLDDIVSQIADGQRVDWRRVEVMLHDPSCLRLLAELKIIGHVRDAGRREGA